MGRNSHERLFGYGLFAVALLLLVGFLWLDGRRDVQRYAALRDEFTSDSEPLTRQVATIQAELLDLSRRVSELESGVAARQTASDETAASDVTSPPAVDPAMDQSAEARAALKHRLEAAKEAADKAAERAATLFSAMDTDSEAFQRMSEVQANAQVDMVYSDMFDELALPPDTAAAVRRVLLDATLHEMQSGITSLQDGKTPDAGELAEARDTREAQVRADLSSILTPEEFARWEQYADTKPARMLASNYDMQLNSLAPGLTLENRELARDVLVEETLLLQGEGADPFAGFRNPETSLQTQAQILENAANRLSTVFNPEQMERFQTFADYQLSMMESATRLFGSP